MTWKSVELKAVEDSRNKISIKGPRGFNLILSIINEDSETDIQTSRDLLVMTFKKLKEKAHKN